MTISIISANGDIRIEEEIHEDCINSSEFEVETSDYLIQVRQNNNDIFVVSNAMNGYGHNCREDFKNAVIEIYN